MSSENKYSHDDDTNTHSWIAGVTAGFGTNESAINMLSDTINRLPESQIGAFFLSIGNFFMGGSLILRYMYVRHRIVMDESGDMRRDTTSLGGRKGDDHETRIKRINRRAAYLGAASVLGALGVASFQESSAGVAHSFFALLFFFGTYVYLTIHIWLDYKAVVGGLGSPFIRKCRIACCVLELGGFIGLTLGAGSGIFCDPCDPSEKQRLAWQVVAFFEIFTFIAFMVHLSTWLADFRHVQIEIAMNNKAGMPVPGQADASSVNAELTPSSRGNVRYGSLTNAEDVTELPTPIEV